MQTSELSKIKFIKKGKHKGKIKIGSQLFTGFLIGKLPKKFAFIYDEENETDGYYHWFNRGGLTYINVE